MINYILCVVVNNSLSTVVGITKLKGPSHLHGKITFPGGKIEDGEDDMTAASREMLEETGLDISPDKWVTISKEVFDHYSLTVVACKDTPEYAKKVEEEPVWILDIPFSLTQAKLQPNAYSADFINILSDVVTTI